MEFWSKKLSKNSIRDRRNIISLQEAGWRTALIWECASGRPELIEELSRWLEGSGRLFVASEITGCRSIDDVDGLELPQAGE
jgi:DNA mismatch endonuclease (patch repair protein)